MKKVLLTLVLAVITVITANAQVYVGGNLRLWRNTVNDADLTDIKITPEIGYSINNNWAAGIAIDYEYGKVSNIKGYLWDINPYARFTFYTNGTVSLFVDGGIDYGKNKIKIDDKSYGWFDIFSAGLKPGITVKCSKHLSLIAKYGFLGYKKYEDTGLSSMNSQLQKQYGENGFGLDLNGYNLSVGLYYNF